MSQLTGNLSPDATPTSSSADPGADPETVTQFEPDSPCRICGGPALCGGLGVVRYNVPVGDARFGKLFRCPHNPVERDLSHQMKLRKLSNLGAFAEKSFDNFLIDNPSYAPAERASLRMAFDVARKYAEFPQGWLLLEGSYGCGKTHLAAAIANIRLRHGEGVLFITSPDLLDHLRSAYAPNSEVTYDETFERVRNTPLLILDDLGVENPSAWAQEKLFQLLNYRYNHNLSTIITTNAAIERLDDRIRSRLLDTAHTHRIRITAPDYRTQRHDERTQLASSLGLYSAMTFETFDVQTGAQPEESSNLQKGLQLAWQYAQHPEDRWLLLAGGFGTGKTHLAAAIANHRRTYSPNPDDILFITVPDLMDFLKTTFGTDATVSFDQRFHQVKAVPLLVLDDLGSEAGSAWAKEKLFQLLDYRYVTRKSTVLTTARDIERLDERLRTRLFDKRLCTLFELTARSFVMRVR